LNRAENFGHVEHAGRLHKPDLNKALRSTHPLKPA
jgi:hypothetical protein